MGLKVLLLNNRVPFPLRDGGAKASYSLIQGLFASEIDLDLFFLNTQKHHQNIDITQKEFKKAVSITQVDVDTKVTLLGAVKGLLSSSSYNIDRFDNDNAHQALEKLLKANKYDVIHFETLFMAPYLETVKKHSDAKCILRMHNVEHLIWQKLANESTQPLKKWYLTILGKQLKKYEEEKVTQFDGLFPISNADANWAKQHSSKSILTLPMGLPIEEKPKSNFGRHFFHLGSMEWQPNVLGCKYLVEEVWPKVLEKLPGCHLHLAGKAMDDSYNSWKSDFIHIHGEVADAKAFMQAYNAMIIPLKSASGLRIKALEAMSLGKPIVSTTIGMSGIEVKEGENCLIANTLEEMVSAIVKLASNINLHEQIAANSYTFVSENFSESILHLKLKKYYEKISKG